MTAIEKIQHAIEAFPGVESAECRYPVEVAEGEPPLELGVIKFSLSQDAVGFRTLEFLAWIVTDMLHGGEHIGFLPTSPPPYLNEPGKSLFFVIELPPTDQDPEDRFTKIAQFIELCHREHWSTCAV